MLNIKRFFETWKKTSRNEIIAKKIENEKNKNKNRMQKFLEAATYKINNNELDNDFSLNDKILPITSTRSNKSNNTDSENSVHRSKSFESKNIFSN